ncbi:MAG: sulfotransferase domain-containing protein [Cyanobacteria bacterium SBC]|nr:sulfotransferase domain-containing protein [Cyanobacteria bacterium SBC]
MSDFLIIGAQKSGTTSLFYYLSHHPMVRVAPQKEVHFFDLQYHLGVEWYLSQFPQASIESHMLSGEASPYYIFHPDVPRRVYELFPNTKIIALLRNPVDRAISQYFHEVKHQFEDLSIERAFQEEPQRLAGEAEKLRNDLNYQSYSYQHHSYLARGRYLEQLQQWWTYFPRNRVLVLNSEAFFYNPQATLSQVFSFLNLPTLELETYPSLNSGNYSTVSESLKQQLQTYFSPFNRALFDELQQNWGW